MEHQEKIERIKSLSEQQLRKQILIPLLIAMGFQNVTEYHGSTERGKDIIFYEIDKLGDKIYTAVVVKTERIHGSIGKAGNIADVVHNQVQQALNEPYVDIYGLEELEIDRCLVITSNDIVPSCIEAFINTLRKQGLDKCFRCYDGNWLAQKIDCHVPGYFEDKDKDEIINEQQAQILNLSKKKDKAVEIIFRLGQEHGIPPNVVNVSSTAVQRAESGVTLASTLSTAVSGELWDYSEMKIKKADILAEFVNAEIMEKTIMCPKCGCANEVDLNDLFVICKNCSNQIL